MTLNEISQGMIGLLDDYQFWVCKLERCSDGRLRARQDYDFAECVRKLDSMPTAGKLEDLKIAIEAARKEERNESHGS